MPDFDSADFKTYHYQQEEKRVALNCLVSPATRNAITQMVGETKESQGEIVDRAVALLAFGEAIDPKLPVYKKRITRGGIETVEREDPYTHPPSRGIRPKGGEGVGLDDSHGLRLVRYSHSRKRCVARKC